MQSCLFSISYAGLWGQHRLSLAELIARAGELGYQSVMIAGKRPHLSPLDAGGERLDQVRQQLDAAGVRCSVIGGYTDFGALAAGEVPILEMHIGYVAGLARVAAALDAPYVRVFTAYERAHQPLPALWSGLVTSLRECCDRAAEHGVSLAVQNHHDVGVHLDTLLELVTEVDRSNCMLGFDAWSQALTGADLYETARRAAPHTAITTNADYVRLPRFHHDAALVNYQPATPDLIRAVPFGQGFIDYDAFFRGLRDGGFDGVATYEMCSPLRGGGSLTNLDRYAGLYLDWMRERNLLDPGGAAADSGTAASQQAAATPAS